RRTSPLCPYTALFRSIMPLAGAFLIMILGKVLKHPGKILASLTLLFLLVLSIARLAVSGSDTEIYRVGGWAPVNSIPVAIYMVRSEEHTSELQSRENL